MRLTLDYDYICSEMDFRQDKKSFSFTSRIPYFSLLNAAALSQNGRIAVKQRSKGHKKASQCVFSINHLGLACHDLFTLVQKRDSSIKANIWLLLSGHFLPLTRMAILPIFFFLLLHQDGNFIGLYNK